MKCESHSTDTAHVKRHTCIGTHEAHAHSLDNRHAWHKHTVHRDDPCRSHEHTYTSCSGTNMDVTSRITQDMQEHVCISMFVFSRGQSRMCTICITTLYGACCACALQVFLCTWNTSHTNAHSTAGRQTCMHRDAHADRQKHRDTAQRDT